MAVTEIWPVHNRADHLLAYVTNRDKTTNTDYDDLKDLIEYDANEIKTERKLYVTGINCEPENAYAKMKEAYKLNDKVMPIVAYHAYQSFRAGEVDAKTAHEIGIKMAEELWGDRFHVVVATHLNTNHYHNHFAICSTSFIDGSRYHDDKASKARMRAASDELCREYGLSVVEHRKYKREKSFTEIIAERNGMPTLLSQMKEDVDRAISQSVSMKQFAFNLRQMGYAVNVRGREEEPILSLTPPGRSHPWRLSNHFGQEYSYNGIYDKIKDNERIPPMPEEKPKRVHLRGGAENFMKVTTLHAIYIHTLYQFGLIPKKNNHRRIPVELREDILKLDSIIEETRLLGLNHIDTDEQLSIYRGQTEETISELTEKRQNLRNRLRRCTDESEITRVKERVSEYSKELTHLRREVKYCDNIAERSGILKEKLSLIYEREKSERKEVRKNEQFR